MTMNKALPLHEREASAATSGYWSPPLLLTRIALNVNSVWGQPPASARCLGAL
jgi:hypothetical protein